MARPRPRVSTIMHSNPFILHLYVIGATHRTPARAARVREGTRGQSDRPRWVFGCHLHTTTGRVLGNQYCCFHVGCWSLWTIPSRGNLGGEVFRSIEPWSHQKRVTTRHTHPTHYPSPQ